MFMLSFTTYYKRVNKVLRYYLARRSTHSWSLLSVCTCLHCGTVTDCRAGTDSRSACLCTLQGTCICSPRHRLCTRRHSCRVTGSHRTRWHPVCRSFLRRRACSCRHSGTRWQSSGHHWHRDLRHRDRLAGTVFLRTQRNDGVVHDLSATARYSFCHNHVVCYLTIQVGSGTCTSGGPRARRCLH